MNQENKEINSKDFNQDPNCVKFQTEEKSNNKKHRKNFTRFLYVILGIILAISINGFYYVFFGQEKSMRKLNAGKELNLYECCSIYTMHCAVWMFGWVISPEAAFEAMLLHIPHSKPVVIDGVDAYALNGYSTELDAKGSSYATMSFKDLRAALALNSPNTIFEVTDTYSMCSIDVRYTDAVDKIGSIPIHTALFRYLQDKGYLHPYTLVYYYIYV